MATTQGTQDGERSLPILLLCDRDQDGLEGTSVISDLASAFQVVTAYAPDDVLEPVAVDWAPAPEVPELAAILISEDIGLVRGGQLLNVLRQMGNSANAPIVILGSTTGPSMAESWLAAGAQGYIVRLPNSAHFASLIKRGVEYWSSKKGGDFRMYASLAA